MPNKPPPWKLLKDYYVVSLSCSTDKTRCADPAHPGDDLKSPMALFTDGDISLIEMTDQLHRFHRFYRGLFVCAAQQGVDQFHVSLPDTAGHKTSRPYSDFLRLHDGLHVLFLEIGTGGNTPVIIKYSDIESVTE